MAVPSSPPPPEDRRAASVRPVADQDGGVSPTARADAMGASMLATLVTGPVVFGLVGWGLEVLTGWRVFVILGILTGMTLSVYTIWVRYREVREP